MLDKPGSRKVGQNLAVPDWARQILELRKRLGFTQAELGARLHYSAMAVSRWERGTKEPTAECYIQLGKLSGEKECWSFWSRAGLRRTDIPHAPLTSGEIPDGRQLAEFEIVHAGSGPKKPDKAKKKIKLFAIPVLPVNAATHGETGDPRADFDDIPPESIIATPDEWSPHPANTSCLRVKGSSMAPFIHDGDIVAVDSSETDPGKLSGKIIVAWHRKHGLSLAEFQKFDGMEVLESADRNYQPILLGKGRNWTILGKVLWLMRRIS